jgi:hypothetical protein
MAQYGQSLDTIDLEKENIYKLFYSYFNDPLLTKIKDINGFSMYVTKTHCLLTNFYRYIIVFVKQNGEYNNTKKLLSTLDWDSLQTRTLTDKYDLPIHTYQPRQDNNLSSIITEIKTDKISSTYICEKFPLLITLLHKDSVNRYKNRGNIVSAIETYNTIITFKN